MYQHPDGPIRTGQRYVGNLLENSGVYTGLFCLGQLECVDASERSAAVALLIAVTFQHPIYFKRLVPTLNLRAALFSFRKTGHIQPFLIIHRDKRRRARLCMFVNLYGLQRTLGLYIRL